MLQILILGIVQGAAELLPVSSSAHVIVVEKLMGLDPSSPEMTFVLVMLHTGTMFAVIVYFWNSWRRHYFSSFAQLRAVVLNVILATILTGIIGYGLQLLIEKILLQGRPSTEMESLFSQLPLIAGALLAVGVLIIIAGLREDRRRGGTDVLPGSAAVIGAVQGLCLPFRGFSRSGATISTGLLVGVGKRRMEEFSFALAVVLTPIAIARELLRLLKSHPEGGSHPLQLAFPGLVGMIFSFVAGLFALLLLSRWLEGGRWQFFGYYCLAAAAIVFALYSFGF
ncbi:MAG: undecaprenyl-diphosphate phosphatase [Verrucomicrobia bacterium]|nr:undecaprenyl-diphosphate phosphatase [Verrucomicrobiota bacterium]